MNSELIEYILNSKISFLDKNPFSNNPLLNFRAKVFYARAIKWLYPSLSNTKFDRLYSVDDLCKLYKIPNAIIGYIKSHLFKTNKVPYPRPHHYDAWYKNFILQTKNNNSLSIFTEDFNLTENEYDLATPVLKKKFATMAGIFLTLNIISRK